jgi:hypothetical protein
MPDPDRWNRLIALSEDVATIDARDGGRSPTVALDEVRSALVQIEELFPRSIDPVDDLEGYCVRRLAKSLLRVLDQVHAECRRVAAGS